MRQYIYLASSRVLAGAVSNTPSASPPSTGRSDIDTGASGRSPLKGERGDHLPVYLVFANANQPSDRITDS